ncbi:MAG TPA: serine/threonine-protein kinase [Polyangiaceae bacterium]|nr:serine/threonine-protein kinase [Polyangiaceae bacterium]
MSSRLPASRVPSSQCEKTLPAASSRDSGQHRKRIGQYRLHGVLGAGGMAKVYLAEAGRGSVRRLYAVKVPHDEFANAPDFVRMFENESTLAAELQHPHVCSAIDYGHHDGTPYLAMEFLKGRSLAALRPVSDPASDPMLHAARCARVIADACEGLQAIHEYGAEQFPPPRIVHRDISPDNLLLTTDGFVKILDFGLAKVDTRREKTEPGLLKGKMAYIAPELLAGEEPSPRSDVWSLGVVAWEMLTGRRLFAEPTDVSTLVAVREQPIQSPSTVVPGIPKSLDAVILRALTRDPAERFQSAEEFGRELWAFMASERRVVRHPELAAWLHELFPADRDAHQSISSWDWTDDEFSSPEAIEELESARTPIASRTPTVESSPQSPPKSGPRRSSARDAWRWLKSAVGL